MAAAPALATAATRTVKPGGATTGKAGTTTVTDAAAGQSVTCTSSTAKSTFKKGSGLSGTGIGTVTSPTVSGCPVPGMSISVTITGRMPINALSFNSTKKTVSMALTKIHGSLSAGGCSTTIDGTGAAAHNGRVKATCMDTGGKLKVLATGGNLHLFNVNCFGVINNGDSVNFAATYTLTPKQVITSPLSVGASYEPGGGLSMEAAALACLAGVLGSARDPTQEFRQRQPGRRARCCAERPGPGQLRGRHRLRR
jgi:hypothetical protein